VTIVDGDAVPRHGAVRPSGVERAEAALLRGLTVASLYVPAAGAVGLRSRALRVGATFRHAGDTNPQIAMIVLNTTLNFGFGVAARHMDADGTGVARRLGLGEPGCDLARELHQATSDAAFGPVADVRAPTRCRVCDR